MADDRIKLIERVLHFIEGADPFGDTFSAHDLDSIRALMGWRDIAAAIDQKAAPWDGEPVLICTNHNWCNRVHRARWTDTIHGHGIFGWAVDDCKHGPYPLRGYTLVTHWQPLPVAVQTAGDDAGGKS